MTEADTAELRATSSPVPAARFPTSTRATAQSSPAVSDTLSTYRSDKRPGQGHYLRHECRVARGAGQVLRVGQRFGAHYCFD